MLVRLCVSAFQEKKGKVSEIYEFNDNLLVVAITGDIQDGYMSLNDTTFYKNIANAVVMPKVKIAKIVEDVKAKGASNLADVAAAYEAQVDTARFVNFNLQSVSGLGVEPAVIAAALKAAPGSAIAPVAGRNAAVVLQVLDKNNKELEYDEAARLAAVARSYEYQSIANGAALTVLQNEADIEDNRINFY